jgi:hypothetical protein
MASKITKALRSERQDNYEKALKDQDKAEWREYIASKREPLTSRNETTGY